MSSKSETTVRTEVVLEIEGKGLLSGGLNDFIIPPGRGSEYYYQGCLYEVVHAIETIGDATAAQGSMLFELLTVLYPDPEKQTTLFGGMKYIGKTDDDHDPSKGIITNLGGGLVLGGQKERLLYLKLRLVHVAGPQKSLVDRMTEAHNAAHPEG